MKKSLTIAIAGAAVILFALTGCSRFSTSQSDTSYEQGKPSRTITTRVTAHTFFDARSELSKFSASQTDKTQGAKVGSLSQTSSGTNAIEVLKQMTELAKALPK